MADPDRWARGKFANIMPGPVMPGLYSRTSSDVLGEPDRGRRRITVLAFCLAPVVGLLLVVALNSLVGGPGTGLDCDSVGVALGSPGPHEPAPSAEGALAAYQRQGGDPDERWTTRARADDAATFVLMDGDRAVREVTVAREASGWRVSGERHCAG